MCSLITVPHLAADSYPLPGPCGQSSCWLLVSGAAPGPQHAGGSAPGNNSAGTSFNRWDHPAHHPTGRIRVHCAALNLCCVHEVRDCFCAGRVWQQVIHAYLSLWPAHTGSLYPTHSLGHCIVWVPSTHTCAWMHARWGVVLVCTRVYTHSHTHTHTHKHTKTQSRSHTHSVTLTHTVIHAHTYTHTHQNKRLCNRAHTVCVCVYVCACMGARMRERMCVCVPMCACPA